MNDSENTPGLNPAEPPPPPVSSVATQSSEPPPAPPAPPAQPAVTPLPLSEIQSKKLVAGLLGILLGGLGIHKFYLGYQQEGIVMILVTLLGGGVGTFLTCGLLAPVIVVMPIIGMVEGILYLTKSDQEFSDTYLTARRPWF